MKRVHSAVVATIATMATLWCCFAAQALAQTPPVDRPPAFPSPPRLDVYVSLGWLNVNKDELGTGNNWFNRGFNPGIAAGWYWTPHLKTDIEAAATRRSTFFASGEERINGLPVYGSNENAFSTRRLTISQQYQFGDNAWFHPHFAAGVDFNWETIDRFDREVYYYGTPNRQLVREAFRHPRRTELHVRPFGEWGFKAYMTERAFFRSDLRFVVGHRFEEMLMRFGFGTDF